MRPVIGADPRSARRTGSTGWASCTCADGARVGIGRRCPSRAGPSGRWAYTRSRRKPAPQQATARSARRRSRSPQPWLLHPMMDRRIMRTTAPSTMSASCTDDTDNRTDGTHRAGITWRAGPRTGPRPATASATQRYHSPSQLDPERLTTAARPTVCAHRTGPSAALWLARASARTTAHADVSVFKSWASLLNLFSKIG